MSDNPRSAAARLMGSARSERKRQAVARNNAKTRFQFKPLSQIKCVCGKCPSDPKTYCPKGRAIKRRQAQGLPLE